MSSLGERKCALLLASLTKRDRRRLLKRLPRHSATRLSGLVRELDSFRFPLEELVGELLLDDVRGLTVSTSLSLEALVDLAERLPAPWFARTLASWTEVDRAFCLSMLPRELSVEVSRELGYVAMPPKLIAAIREESAALVALARVGDA